MDPPHITEFASERYFSKLNQLADTPESTITTNGVQPQPIQPSTFILPLRSSKISDSDGIIHSPEQRHSDRSRLFRLRSKVSLLHTRQVVAEPHLVPYVDKAAEANNTRR